MQATSQIARKVYKCGKCKGEIKIGQLYYKRRESGRVYNRMTHWNLEWHANSEDCK